MGYFGAGFAFSSQPDWSRLDALPATMSMRGWAHRSRPAWLLDVWSPRMAHTFPFCDAYEMQWMPRPASVVIDRFEQLMSALAIKAQGSTWMAWTATISRSLGLDTYFFAGDDEDVNVAILADRSDIVRVAFTAEQYELRYANQRWSVTPLHYPDDDIEPLQPPDLRHLAYVDIRPIRTCEEKRLYEHATAEWPTSLGDPVEVLGIGTWDPFDKVSEEFKVDYERIAVVTPPTVAPRRAQPLPAQVRRVARKKPWWKFW